MLFGKTLLRASAHQEIYRTLPRSPLRLDSLRFLYGEPASLYKFLRPYRYPEPDQTRVTRDSHGYTHGSGRSSRNPYFVEAVAEMNVELSIKELMAKSPALYRMAEKGQVKMIGAIPGLETGKVRFY